MNGIKGVLIALMEKKWLEARKGYCVNVMLEKVNDQIKYLGIKKGRDKLFNVKETFLEASNGDCFKIGESKDQINNNLGVKGMK
jgi:hypothetical protein